MSPPAADGAALVAAAVQAALREGAPRRTVAAVAAAVAGTVLSAASQSTRLATKPRVLIQEAPTDAEAGNPEQLLASLRTARRAQRQRKKQRRREAKAALSPSSAEIAQQPAAERTHISEDTAGLCSEHVGASDAVPALVLHSPVAPVSAAGAATSMQPKGRKLQRLPKRPPDPRIDLTDLGISDTQSNISASVASSGMLLRGRTVAGRSSPYEVGHSSVPFDPGGK